LVLKSGNGTTLDTLVLTITVIKDTGIISGSKINTGTTKIGMFFQEGTVVGVNLVRGKYTVSVYDIFGNSIWQTAGYAATPNKYLIDLKTVKPNIEGFIGYKRKLLEWIAQELIVDDQSYIYSMIGIPYNPYAPKPYSRWTLRGIFDLSSEVCVAEELWNFIGGDGTYKDLLDCFEQAGIELRPEIDEYFNKFK